MIEKIVRDYLLTKLSIPVHMSYPDSPEKRFVIVDRTGGGIEEHLRNATIAVQSYAESKIQASTLHEDVLTAMQKITELDAVSECTVNSEYPFEDTTRKKDRYQAVFYITYY